MKILGHIPKIHFHVACSAGSDSMVLVDFLRKYPKNDFDLLYFNHGTESCQEAESFLKEFSTETGIKLHIGMISRIRSTEESQEEYWRKERYNFLSKFSSEPILMAHHLNDVIETWTMTSLHGNPKLIPYFNHRYNVYRPMLCVSKSEIRDWAKRHNVKFVLDKSNYDISIRRNYVRHEMMDSIYRISPGIEKILSKKIEAAYTAEFSEKMMKISNFS